MAHTHTQRILVRPTNTAGSLAALEQPNALQRQSTDAKGGLSGGARFLARGWEQDEWLTRNHGDTLKVRETRTHWVGTTQAAMNSLKVGNLKGT